MRKSADVFTSAERRALTWAAVVTALIVSGGMALDRAFGPSLGEYAGGGITAPPMPGVIDAQPAG